MIANSAYPIATGTAATTKATWTGRVVSGLVVLFLLVDAVMKVARADVSVDATVELGYPDGSVVWIGLALLAATAVYVIPRTAVLGAVLLTGFLGGAVATQVRLEEPAFLFPVALGVLVWVGLGLRDGRVRSLVS